MCSLSYLWQPVFFFSFCCSCSERPTSDFGHDHTAPALMVLTALIASGITFYHTAFNRDNQMADAIIKRLCSPHVWGEQPVAKYWLIFTMTVNKLSAAKSFLKNIYLFKIQPVSPREYDLLFSGSIFVRTGIGYTDFLFLISCSLFLLLFQSFLFHFHPSFFPSDARLAFIAHLQSLCRVRLMV